MSNQKRKASYGTEHRIGGALMSINNSLGMPADETTYTVEEAEIGDDEGFEVIVVYLQEWCNEEMSDFGDDKTEQKAFMYWTKDEVNHKEYKEYCEWLEKEAKKRAILHL